MARGSPRPKPPEGGIGHISYSGLSTGLECLKRFQLTRIAQAPQLPAWWFAGGTAVHAVTEDYDRALFEAGTAGRAFAWDRRDILNAWEKHFEAEIEKLKKKEPDDTKWRAGKEKYKEWNVSGPEQVQNYIEWRRRSPYEIWITPDGTPAIELDISGYLPGCGLEILAYLDRVFIDPFLQCMAVVDLKSGKTKPTSGLQFGVYSARIQEKYGEHPVWGAALMTREGQLHKPYSLGKYSPEYVGKQLGHLERIVAARAFPANVGGGCWNCDVSASCFAQDGPLAERYDPDHPGYAPPF